MLRIHSVLISTLNLKHSQTEQEPAESHNLTIISSNTLHGHHLQEDSNAQEKLRQGLIKIAQEMEEKRLLEKRLQPGKQ